MSAPPVAPRVRRFSFRLRTLLLAITVLALWLGWNVDHVIERDRLLTSHDFLRALEPRLPVREPPASAPRPRPIKQSIPIAGKLLGAEALEMDVWLRDDQYTPADSRRIQSLFPECQVTLIAAETAAKVFLR